MWTTLKIRIWEQRKRKIKATEKRTKASFIEIFWRWKIEIAKEEIRERKEKTCVKDNSLRIITHGGRTKRNENSWQYFKQD